jgi:hypothetical protein
MGVLGTDCSRAVRGPGINLAAARINRIQGPARELDAAVFVLLGFLFLCDVHNYIISHIKIGVKRKTPIISPYYVYLLFVQRANMRGVRRSFLVHRRAERRNLTSSSLQILPGRRLNTRGAFWGGSGHVENFFLKG